ncbi:MAG: hypothetical protein N2316_01420 [Spirochaetes bacterium]|nr:hypothetical protein [Spirochaetota bacterium]
MKIYPQKSHFVVLPILIILFKGTIAAFSFSFSSDAVRFERAKEHFRKGIVHFNKKQYLAAVEYFRNAISAYPDYFTAREYLARSYKFSGFIEEALREWESLLEYAPENVAIKNKIEAIRYRKYGIERTDTPTDLVMTSEIVSKQLVGYRFPHPVDCATDNEKNIYITSFSLGKLCKISPNGNGIGSFAPTLQSKLFGIDYYKNKIAVTDFAKNRIYVLTPSLKKMFSFGETGYGDGQFHGPEGVCFDEAGNIYVVDSGNARVQKFNPQGNFILKFGKEGDFEGDLNSPTDVKAVGDVVYISDTGNKRISIFDDSGNFIKNISHPEFSKPRGLSYKDPYLVISDEKKGLCFYDVVKGNFQWFTEWHNGTRKFGALYSAIYDRDGALLALDYAHERLMCFVAPKMQYTNLDVEITAVDTRQYPIVTVYCNVRGRAGNPLVGLTKENFQITEDDMRVTRLSVDYLKRIEPASSIVLCIDRSASAEEHHSDYSWAAEFLLTKIRINDRIKVINFNKDFWEGNDFDWSRRRALKAINIKEYKHTGDYGNVLYNAVYDVIP